jgi:hypothetical protein
MEENFIIPFGRYRGKNIATLINDPEFRNWCNWAINQPGIKIRYSDFCQIVINNYSPPQDTPEHNKLQNMFLDDNFCLALGKLCNWKPMNIKKCIRNLDKAIKNTYKNNCDWEKIDELKSMKEYIGEPILDEDNKEVVNDDFTFLKIKTIFEEYGWDVIIQSNDSECKSDCLAYNDCDIKIDKIAIEIKPYVGDDYPAILRQMKMTQIHPYCQCLVYENFNAIGATIDQLKSVFASSGFMVFSFDDIKKAQKEIQ